MKCLNRFLKRSRLFWYLGIVTFRSWSNWISWVRTENKGLFDLEPITSTSLAVIPAFLNESTTYRWYYSTIQWYVVMSHAVFICARKYWVKRLFNEWLVTEFSNLDHNDVKLMLFERESIWARDFLILRVLPQWLQHQAKVVANCHAL